MQWKEAWASIVIPGAKPPTWNQSVMLCDWRIVRGCAACCGTTTGLVFGSFETRRRMHQGCISGITA